MSKTRTDHDLKHIETSHFDYMHYTSMRTETIYQSVCECGWVSGMHSTARYAERMHRKHSAKEQG